MNSNRTLKLTLKRQPFQVMKTFEKSTEYRKPSEWIKSRIYNKDGTERDYDFVEFSNGYGSQVPKFKAVYCGFEICETNQTLTYSNGLIVEVEEGDIMICFMRQGDFDELIKILDDAHDNLTRK